MSQGYTHFSKYMDTSSCGKCSVSSGIKYCAIVLREKVDKSKNNFQLECQSLLTTAMREFWGGINIQI